MTLSEADRKIVVGQDGVITIPAVAFSKPTAATEKLIFMKSSLGGMHPERSRLQTHLRKSRSPGSRSSKALILAMDHGHSLPQRSLLDEVEHPATELVALYATRWKEELFFRELKSHLHGRDNLLDAQTPETAAQEVLAMLLAASLVAMQREAVAGRADVEILRISFAKVMQKTAALCELLAVGSDLIEPAALAKWIERILDDLQTGALIQKRKPRSCPRTLRQPTKDWPKTKTPSSKLVTKTIVILNP